MTRQTRKENIIIPVDQIKHGIIHCLHSSRRIQDIAQSILIQYQTELDNGGTSIDPKYSIIMFYYAIEELGKAIILEEFMNDAIQKNLTEIKIYKYIGDHNQKINKAQKQYPNLTIEKFKEEIIDVHSNQQVENKSSFIKKITHFQWKSDGEIIRSFTDRSNLWLVTFDESNNKWLNPINNFDIEELKNKIKLLDEIISDWLTKASNSYQSKTYI